MVITWYGQSCFKVQSGEKTLLVDPFDKSVGLIPPSVQTDVLIITHQHGDHNNVNCARGEYFIVDSPGEYEVKGAKIRGISSFHDNESGAKHGLNTMYVIELEGIKILHMGDFGEDALSDNQIEIIGSVDILMIPVGGGTTIGAKSAVSVINQSEPKLVIPMHYKIPKLSSPELTGINEFLEEFGEEEITAQDKLVIKQKDFSGESEEKIRLVVLKV